MKKLRNDVRNRKETLQKINKKCHGTIWPKGHNLASSFGDG
jgi:hypothetical protein